MTRVEIKPHQIWKQRNADFQIYIQRKKGDKWLCKVLTNKPDKFNGTHTMSSVVLWKRFELLK